MLQFDEVASRRVERSYLTPDVVAQRREIVSMLAPRAGEDALDIGSGPGLLACDLAREIGPSGNVRGIDPSESMLALAERREPEDDAAPVSFGPGDALELPFEDASFDIAVSTQVYEYLEEVDRALAEAHRVLRPGGRLLVLDTDWDSVVWHSGDPDRMRRVMTVWDEHLADPHLPRRLSGLLEEAGFAVERRSVLPILNAGFDEDTYSSGLIGFVSTFVTGRAGISEDEAAAWADELRAMGDRYFFSVNRYLFLARKPD